MLTDKEQKKEFKKTASEEPDKYYPTKALRRNGFNRHQCTNCGMYHWNTTGSEICGEPACNAGFQVVENNPTKNKLSYIDVWNKIVEILEPRGYKPLKRYPVVARWNPTTEFTIASIAAFQPYVIAGEIPPPAKKLLIPQFSLRFGDIENVGITGSHCTGFVMIGQHQFVSPEEWDQEQAWQDIYDFLVEGVGLDKNEITIHEDAWAGGGNFGPCMEFFSRGVELFNQVYMMFQQTEGEPIGLKLKVLDMGLGQERVAWFSQGTPNIYEAIFPEVLTKIRDRTKVELDYALYNRFSQFSAFLNIDEVEDMDAAWGRVAQELDIDAQELKEKIVPMTGIYSIAEHSRALLFAISDGKLPSNVGGGYNLRVIFRRAMMFIDQFQWDLDMADICKWHAEELFALFPEVSEHLDEVREVLDVEKEKFLATKEEAQKIVKRLIKKKEITEDTLIELYDSNGIRPEIIRDAAAKLGKKIKIPDDFSGKVLARHEKKAQIHATHKKVEIDVEGLPETEKLYFADWTLSENEAKVLKVVKIKHEIEDEEAEEVTTKTIDAWAVVLDKSVAYPTSGGQLHDNGTINGVPIVDVLKVEKCTVHILSEKPTFRKGSKVKLEIDMQRRSLLTHHHSATHIVNAAAREVLGSHINQAGAKKTLGKAHLDITHYDSLSDEELAKIEQVANKFVKQDVPSKNRFMSRDEAEKEYGFRLYQGGAVPGVELRIVETPGIEVEACGGTHVNSTGEIGQIKIIKSQKIQDGIVRLTYTAGETTKQLIAEHKRIEKELSKILGVPPKQMLARAEELLEKWRALRKAKSTGVFDNTLMELYEKSATKGKILPEMVKKFDTPINKLVDKVAKLKNEWEEMKVEISQIAKVVGKKNVQSLLDSADEHEGYKLITAVYPGMDNKILTNLSKNLLKGGSDIVVILAGNSSKGANMLALCGKAVKNLDLGATAKKTFKTLNGKGGGKKDSVQGFFPGYTESLEQIIELFKSQL